MFHQEADDQQETVSEVSPAQAFNSPSIIQSLGSSERLHQADIANTNFEGSTPITTIKECGNITLVPQEEFLVEAEIQSDSIMHRRKKSSPSICESEQVVHENDDSVINAESAVNSCSESQNTSFEDNVSKEGGIINDITMYISQSAETSNLNTNLNFSTAPSITYDCEGPEDEATKVEMQDIMQKTVGIKGFHSEKEDYYGSSHVTHSPSKKSQNSVMGFLKSKNPTVDSSSRTLTNFKATHSWKTQTKMAFSGKEGSSVVTVPCDGKGNLLGCEITPMVSPLPPGVLEEPITSRSSKVEDIRGQLLDFLEERGNSTRNDQSPINDRFRKQFLGYLQDQKIKNVENKLGTSEELEGLTEPTSQSEDDDGVTMYEEDSNDGMDRKLQEFDDDEHIDDQSEEMLDDDLNGNIPHVLTSITRGNLHTITEQSGDDATPDFPTDISSDDNGYNDNEENRNGEYITKNRSYNTNTSKQERKESFNSDIISAAFNEETPKGKDSDASPDVPSNRRPGAAGNVAWIVDGVGGIGATGTVFHLRLVGSVEVSEEIVSSEENSINPSGNPGKRPRKEMVTDAVTKLKVCGMLSVVSLYL